MARVSKKYPEKLLKALVTAVDDHPGATKDDLAPFVRPYHDQWYNAAKAKESDFGRYFNGAMKKAGSHGKNREIRFFKKKNEQGKTVNAHAITSTTEKVEIIEAQIFAIDQQVGSLLSARRVMERKLEKFRKEGKTVGMVVDGEIVERMG